MENKKLIVALQSTEYRLHRVAAIFPKLGQNAAKEGFAGSSLRFPEQLVYGLVFNGFVAGKCVTTKPKPISGVQSSLLRACQGPPREFISPSSRPLARGQMDGGGGGVNWQSVDLMRESQEKTSNLGKLYNQGWVIACHLPSSEKDLWVGSELGLHHSSNHTDQLNHNNTI